MTATIKQPPHECQHSERIESALRELQAQIATCSPDLAALWRILKGLPDENQKQKHTSTV